MVDLERSTQLTSGPELRDVAANRDQYEPKAGLHYKSTDTGAEFIGDGNRWNKIQSTGSNPSFRSVDTDELSSKSQPASYHVNTDGSDITAVPHENGSYSGELSKVTGTDIGPLLYDLIVNQLPPQGSEKEATGKIYVKAGTYPGKLSNATGGAVPIASQLTLEGESVSHWVSGGTSTIPTQNPGVLFKSDGDAFRNPNVDGDNVIYPVIRNIEVIGAGATTGTALVGTNSNLLDWLLLDTVVFQKFLSPIDLSSSTGNTKLHNCQFRQFGGRANFNQRCWLFPGNGINAADGGDIRLSGARCWGVKFQGKGEGAGQVVRMNNGGSLFGCRIAKIGSNSGSGRGVDVASSKGVTILGCTFDEAEGATGSWLDALAFRISDSDNSRVGYCTDRSSSTNSIKVNAGIDPRFAQNDFPNGVSVGGGTRNRWEGVIAGGPFGGTDIGALTGASEGDIARGAGTTGSADALYILKSTGDWQALHDPTVTITPA